MRATLDVATVKPRWEEDAEWRLVPVVSSSICLHVETACEQCLETWGYDYEVLYGTT